MKHMYLDYALRNEVCHYLGVPVEAPTLRYLNGLIHAYTRRVPWESVTRIIKSHTTPRVSDCPRWPQEFWQDAMAWHTGGTCYESSLAFYSLLGSLGYEAYLTVNDMGSTRGCHAAIVVRLGGRKYLVDITVPIYDATPFDPRRPSTRNSLFHNYTIRPQGEDCYRVTRSHHPNREAFTLIDIPIPESRYRDIVAADYTETGFFLKSVVIVRIINDKVWRFFSDRQPYRLESFNRMGRAETPLASGTVTESIAGRFGIPRSLISAAFASIQAAV